MSNWLLRFVFVLFTILAGSAAIAKDLPKEEQMIVRIAEIQVDRSQLEEYSSRQEPSEQSPCRKSRV